MNANRLSNLSQADTDENIGQFWDAHDFTDFDNPAAPDVEFETAFAVPIEAELFAALERYAHQRGAQVGQSVATAKAC